MSMHGFGSLVDRLGRQALVTCFTISESVCLYVPQNKDIGHPKTCTKSGKWVRNMMKIIKNVEYYACLFSENSFYPDSTTGNERPYSKSEFVSIFHLRTKNAFLAPFFEHLALKNVVEFSFPKVSVMKTLIKKRPITKPILTNTLCSY